MPLTAANLQSPAIMTDAEKQILCASLAIGTASLEYFLIFKQGPRLIELAGSIIIQLTKSSGEVLSTAIQQPAAIAAAVNPLGGGSSEGGAANSLAQVIPFLK